MFKKKKKKNGRREEKEREEGREGGREGGRVVVKSLFKNDRKLAEVRERGWFERLLHLHYA